MSNFLWKLQKSGSRIGPMSSPAIKKALAALLRDPNNSTCADCKTAGHPRWASWSLGVFICIKCAGIHRSLGTHISKVKSVDLDTWQEEHMRKVVEFGNNAAANAVYECKLSGNHTPEASKIADFIRNKYELKKWIGNAAEVSAPPSRPKTVEKKPQVAQQAHGSQTSLVSQTSSAPSRSATSSQVDLNLASPSVASRTTLNAAAREPSGRPDLKKSILSLYSRPRTSTASVASGASNASFSSSTGTPSIASNSTPAAGYPLPGASFSLPAQTNTTSSASLEDNDLFKNVWS
ncbi:GTPase-activating protein AGE2 [Lachancea thermotolerans CBS 6340]|uniref:KLTH0A04048p n=1 Tax=Lachancea thermotolerans (strain ATCC 56472 / CBS 6340 / NRRL Y-8284) TaxID=559295 RepID=C5DBN3_LACTC|nr:KLTH0A04048p [Lachancea thermotolerans CBS 6340]CAR21190.1 KLTH0A04048p [Lachancea thermotolerans CBS 6340]